MSKSISLFFSIIAISVVTVTLLSSTYTQTQISEQSIDMSQMDMGMIDKIRSMGGLQLVMPQAFAETDCGALEQTGRTVVEFNLTGESVELPIMGGKTYNAMTFNGQVPGPTLRVTQGDVVKMTLTIPADEVTGHGNDMHASQISALTFDSVNPGETSQYCYIAESAGVFKYHCSGVHLVGMDQHVFSGMYGIAIVDPINGYKKLMVEKTSVSNGKVSLDRQFYDADALEFTLQYNQLYLTPEGNYDAGAMFKHHNSATVVNGMQFGYVPNETHNLLINEDVNKNIFVAQPWNSADLLQYQSQPLYVPIEEHIRFFIENHGNEPVNWHIVGEIIDRVTQGNKIKAHGIETWLIGGSQGAIVDVVFDEPGVYVAVNHDYAALFTGAASVIIAGDPFSLGVEKSYAELFGNPIDAIPPHKSQSITHSKISFHQFAATLPSELIVDGDVPKMNFDPISLNSETQCLGYDITIFGTPDDDDIDGTPERDVIHGFGGIDRINGLGGDDIICGGDGDDWLYGGPGNDAIHGGKGNDSIFGESGNDRLWGGPGDDGIHGEDWLGRSISGFSYPHSDILWGNGGDDMMAGGYDDDVLFGGAGHDEMYASLLLDPSLGDRDTGNDLMYGGPGNDEMYSGNGGVHEIFGGSGDDSINGLHSDTLIADGGSGDDRITGSDNPDIILGGTGNDVIYGADGHDEIYGNSGDDDIWGGKGNDLIFGNSNEDEIHGGKGNDIIDGGSYGDVLYGDEGNDQLEGGTGDDRIHGGDGNDSITGGDGRDTLLGEAGNDWISGNNGDDSINGGDGDDNLFGRAGYDTIRGGDGDDNLFGGKDGIDDDLDGESGSNYCRDDGIDLIKMGCMEVVWRGQIANTSPDSESDSEPEPDFGNDNDRATASALYITNESNEIAYVFEIHPREWRSNLDYDPEWFELVLEIDPDDAAVINIDCGEFMELGYRHGPHYYDGPFVDTFSLTGFCGNQSLSADWTITR